MIVWVMNVLRVGIHDGRGPFDVTWGITWGKGLDHLRLIFERGALRQLTTGRLRRPTGSVRPRGAMGLHIWIRRKDVNLFRRCREVVCGCPGETMSNRMVMVSRVGRGIRIRGGPRTVVRVVRCVGTGTTVARVMRVLIVPVRDWNVTATVTVFEDHLGGQGVGTVVVRVAFL